MQPAFSVIFLTTLIGAAQGLFLALYLGQLGFGLGILEAWGEAQLYGLGSLLAFVLLAGGLTASFFHLGHPERAWRAAAQWRTSWLSREVIVLPAFMFSVLVYGLLSYNELQSAAETGLYNGTGKLTLLIGAIATGICLLLYLCTGMIYACMKFLQEWATPLTVINFTLLGSACGFTFASALAIQLGSALTTFFVLAAILITALALLSRGATLIRNAHLKHASTLQSAIGVRDIRIRQMSQGAMGGSFNTREFFHGRTPAFVSTVKWLFLVACFAVPILLLAVGFANQSAPMLLGAALSQFVGTVLERWYFFAEARHVQNLYYQTV